MKRNFNDPVYKKWRKEVYERDKFCCRWPNCGSRRKINAHHIKTWAHFPHLRYEINNGITLCKRHHDMIRGNEDQYSTSFLKILLSDIESQKQKRKPND